MQNKPLFPFPAYGEYFQGKIESIFKYINPKSLLNFVFAFIVLISATPYIGLTVSGLIFIGIVGLIIADQVVVGTLTGDTRSTVRVIIELILVSTFCLVGMWLMTGFDGPAQILGMGTIAVLFAQKVVVETLGPVRFWMNITPPLLSAVYFEVWSAVGHARSGDFSRVMTDFANLVLVLIIFMVIRAAVINRRRRWKQATTEVADSARKAREAHKIAMLAEQLAGSGHFRIDLKDEVSTFSSGLCEIYGFDERKGAPGLQDLARLYSEDDCARLFDMIAKVIQTRRPERIEAQCRLRDGRERILLTQANAEIGEDGEVSAVLGVSMDVTEARMREAALAQSEARLRLLADHVTDIVLWISAGGKVLYASPSVESLGYAPEAMVGKALADYILPADYGAATRLLNRVFDDDPEDRDLKGEFRFLSQRSDAAEVWLEGFARAVRDPSGWPRSAVFNFRNVTRRRELEEDLREAKTRAESAAEAKSEFLANMSHEVRTPLTGVIGFSGLLAQMPGLPASADVYLRRVTASGQALLTVVNDILDFSKLEAGQLELDPAPLSLRGFLEDVAGLFSAQAEAKGLQMEIRLEAPAPEHVLVDRARLQQVLANLLSNAIKFTDSGAIFIQARYDGAQQALEVAVSDTGAGISAEAADRLFQRFTQADGSISRRYGGTGLGLSICRQLTELMGGGIDVVSAPGAGATFTFTVQAPPVDGRVEAETSPDAIGSTDAALRILLVDDLEANRELVRALLGVAGLHEVEEASSGPQAITMAVRQPYDIILMDLQMPGMDGFSASRAIRQLSKVNTATPIIALSANVLAEHVHEAEQAGMNDHVGKPIVPAQLFKVINRWAGVRLDSPVVAEASPEKA